jgi:hypothetical protein
MTDPLITINGRTLNEPQTKSLMWAVKAFHEVAKIMGRSSSDEELRIHATNYDRLEEILGILGATPTARAPVRASSISDTINVVRTNRILQLAGFVPEQANAEARALAERFAATTEPIDVLAMRLRKAAVERDRC